MADALGTGDGGNEVDQPTPNTKSDLHERRIANAVLRRRAKLKDAWYEESALLQMATAYPEKRD